jgi:hypothetical protein
LLLFLRSFVYTHRAERFGCAGVRVVEMRLNETRGRFNFDPETGNAPKLRELHARDASFGH